MPMYCVARRCEKFYFTQKGRKRNGTISYAFDLICVHEDDDWILGLHNRYKRWAVNMTKYQITVK